MKSLSERMSERVLGTRRLLPCHTPKLCKILSVRALLLFRGTGAASRLCRAI
jgi:hypothetical protein